MTGFFPVLKTFFFLFKGGTEFELPLDQESFWYPEHYGCPPKLAKAAAMEYVGLYWLSGRNREPKKKALYKPLALEPEMKSFKADK